MEEENKGITLKGICKTIWLRKWVALVVAVVVVLACAISINYAYNHNARYYEIEFSLNLPGSNNDVVYSYPDGKQFNYASITSKETLGEIKDSSDEFANLDVDRMASNGNIHISRDIAVIANSSETSKVIREITYTISAKASYFTDKNQAKEFLMKLANTPKDHLRDMKIENGVYLPLAKAAIDYETEIGFLKNQLEVLQGEYDELIKTYGGSFVGDTNGTTLLAYSQEVKAYLDSGVLDNYLIQVRGNNQDNRPIVKSEDCKNYYKDMQESLKREQKIKQDTLNNVLTPSGAGSSVIIDVDASVLKLSQEVAELQDKISAVDGYVMAGDAVTVQEDFLNAAYEKVEGLTNTFTTTCKNVYDKASAVIYTQPGVVVVNGGFGLITTVLISLVIGIIVALVAAYVAGYLTLKKKKANEETTLDATPEEQSATVAEASEKENKD